MQTLRQLTTGEQAAVHLAGTAKEMKMRALICWLRAVLRTNALEDARAHHPSAPTLTVAENRETQGRQGEQNDNVSRISIAAKPSEFTVADVVEKGTDMAKNQILCVFSKVPPQYAIYITHNRLVVQYADDPKRADEQRKKMATLNGLRMQIEGLVYGWRMSRFATHRRRAKKFDIRVAAALVLCLEGDSETAHAALIEIKDDIVAERTSWARFEYLITASLISLGAVALLFAIQRQLLPFNLPPGDLWLSTRAGVVGAFFSIALAIRTRTVLTNLQRRDNVADAILRIVIGMIAAGVLLLLIQAGVVPKFQIGDATLSAHLQWQAVLIVGFLAGFSERLVPDLLAKSATGDSGAARKADSSASSKGPGGDGKNVAVAG